MRTETQMKEEISKLKSEIILLKKQRKALYDFNEYLSGVCISHLPFPDMQVAMNFVSELGMAALKTNADVISINPLP